VSLRSLVFSLFLAGSLLAPLGCSGTPGSAPGDHTGTGTLSTATSKGQPHSAKPNITAPPPIEPVK